MTKGLDGVNRPRILSPYPTERKVNGVSQFKKHQDATNEIVRNHQKGEPVIVDVMGCSWSVTCTDVTKYGNEWGPPRITLEPVAAVAWSGKGLPPVGTKCQMQDDKTVWVEVDIIANKYGFAHGWAGSRIKSYFSSQPSEFRPIPTAEQIAAEARKVEVDRLCRVVMGHPAYHDHNRDIHCSAAMRLAVEAIVDHRTFDVEN